MSGQNRPRTTLARYADRAGRPHRVVLSRHLLVDLSPRQLPRLVARLGEGEGEPQARALLDGSAIDEGYLARARRESRPFIRPVVADDLRRCQSARGSGEPEHDLTAHEPPLAA